MEEFSDGFREGFCLFEEFGHEGLVFGFVAGIGWIALEYLWFLVDVETDGDVVISGEFGEGTVREVASESVDFEVEFRLMVIHWVSISATSTNCAHSSGSWRLVTSLFASETTSCSYLLKLESNPWSLVFRSGMA